jgi:predicted Zn-dependent protease
MDYLNQISQQDELIRETLNISKSWANISSYDEYVLGREVAATLLSSYRLYTDDLGFIYYLNLICNAVTVNSSMTEIYAGYHVGILDTQEINVFSTPGGHLFVTRGFTSLAQSEDDLAAIIAWGIATIQLKQGIDLIKYDSLLNSVYLTALATNDEEDLDKPNIETLLEEKEKEQVFEADAFTVKLLLNTGYEPNSLIDMLKRSGEAGGDFVINKTHPDPQERILKLQQQLGTRERGDTRSLRFSRFFY